jgi:hypothetical protein
MSAALIDWVLAHFHHSPLHFAIGVGMILFIVYLLTKKSYRQPTEEKLTPEEEEQLIRDWEPKPLVNKQTLPELRHDVILEGTSLLAACVCIILSLFHDACRSAFLSSDAYLSPFFTPFFF